jgi:hypothetical protein
MDQQEPSRDIPEARYIDYAPPAATRKGMFWRSLLAVVSALCLAIGTGMAIACNLSARNSSEAMVFGALAGGFLTAGVALPGMIYLMRRL